jgi:hypothetical protein
MNLYFSLSLFLFSLSSIQAREVFVINHWRNDQKARTVIKLLNNDFGIPKNLITMIEKENPCLQSNSMTLFELCISKKNELKFLKLDAKAYRRSFEHLKRKN